MDSLYPQFDNICKVGLQMDLSATLFEEKGSQSRKKNKDEIRFRWMDLFKHTVDLYSLGEAKKDGIIKNPKLEKVKVYEGEKRAALSITKNFAHGKNTKICCVRE